MEKLEASIIVPVYKAEPYLKACLDSILAQSMSSWECILVDDGSPDRSGTICDDYAARDSRFRVIHKANAGVGAARNSGLEAARGEWVLFVDSDDWLDSQHLDPIRQAASGVQVLQVGIIRNYASGGILSDRLDEELVSMPAYVRKKLWRSTSVTYFFRRAEVERLHLRFPTQVKYSEDRQFIATFLLEQDRVQTCRSCAYHYRINQASACQSVRPLQHMTDDLKVLQAILAYAREREIRQPDLLAYLTPFLVNSFFEALYLHRDTYAARQFIPAVRQLLEECPSLSASLRRKCQRFIQNPSLFMGQLVLFYTKSRYMVKLKSMRERLTDALSSR